MVNKLVAAITSGKSSSQISSATNEIINPAGASMSSGGSTKAAAPTAAPAASAKTGYGSNSAIDAAIKAAPNHSKTLSAAEKKSHVELWQYLATKYGKAPNTSTYIALGKALGVKTGTTASTITSAQKAEILKLLKQKGYASGSSYIPRSGYIWMDEAGAGSEMILRQADNARLAYAQRGCAGGQYSEPVEMVTDRPGIPGERGSAERAARPGIPGIREYVRTAVRDPLPDVRPAAADDALRHAGSEYLPRRPEDLRGHCGLYIP